MEVKESWKGSTSFERWIWPTRDIFRSRNQDVSADRRSNGLGHDKYKVHESTVENVWNTLAEEGQDLNTEAREHKWHLPPGNILGLDLMPEYEHKMIPRFQQVILDLKWAVELGRIDILTEAGMLLQYQANLQEKCEKACPCYVITCGRTHLREQYLI